MSLVELFCHVDDFCQAFEPLWIRDHFTTGRRRAGPLCLSEIMTLLIWFHTSHYRMFKAFYQQHVSASPRCISGRSQLWAFCRVHTFGTYSVERLSASMSRSLHGNFVYRLDPVGHLCSFS